jgi:NADPH:quinone reductase-like Zn-dependent oxidoreductase
MHDAWDALVGLYGAGLLRSRISRRYALSDAASAHRLLESRTSVDKLLLVP